MVAGEHHMSGPEPGDYRKLVSKHPLEEKITVLKQFWYKHVKKKNEKWLNFKSHILPTSIIENDGDLHQKL